MIGSLIRRVATSHPAVGLVRNEMLSTTLPSRSQVLFSTSKRTLMSSARHSRATIARGRARVNALLAKEYTPSSLMVRVRQFSKDTNAATSAAKGGILAFPKEHPFATNIIIATIKTSLCDIMVQKYIEGKEWADLDWKRVGVFTAFGCAYLGFFQWAIYVTLFGKLWPGMAKFANKSMREKMKDKKGMLNVFWQSCFDNFIHYTFIYFPTFYIFKEAIQGTGYEKTITSVTGKSLGKYKENFWEDNFKIWGLWMPGDMIIYAVPMWLRLPLNHALSFVWTCYLSFLRGDKIEEGSEAAVADGSEASAVVAAVVAETESVGVATETEFVGTSNGGGEA